MFLKKGGIHHICVEVPDIKAAVQQMKSKGVRVLGEPKNGAHGLPVIFLHPKDCNGLFLQRIPVNLLGVLIELEEHKDDQ